MESLAHRPRADGRLAGAAGDLASQVGLRVRRGRDALVRRPQRVALSAAYVALRLIPATTHPAGVTPDSASYLKGMTLSSHPPVVPVVYALLGGHVRHIAMAQGLVGAVCWLVLAATASRLVHSRWAKGAMIAGILVVGLCDAVDRWDSAMLSESLAISLGVLLLACVLRAIEHQTPARVAAVVALATVWALTRDVEAVFLGVVALVWAVWWPTPRRRLLIPAGIAGAALLAAVSVWTSGRSSASFDDVIAVRVLTNPDRQAYFLRHGMPAAVERLRWRLADRTDPHDPFFTAPDLASFRRWSSRRGRITYLLYAFEHPGWAVITPLRSPETLGGPVANPPLDGYGGPGYESLLPTELQRLLFEDKPAALLLEVLAVAAVAALAIARRDQASWLLPASVAALAVPHALLAWHGDTLEVGRHAVVAAVQLRIGLVMTAVVLADRVGGPAISARPTPNLS